MHCLIRFHDWLGDGWAVLFSHPKNYTGDPTRRTASDNQTVRNVFVIRPDKRNKTILVYPMTTGRNFDEVLQVINSL